jgi:hypothetical protein
MSLGTYDCPTRMIASLRTPLGEQSDWSASYKYIFVYNKGSPKIFL